MNLIVENIWNILFLCAVLCAVLNSIVCVLVLLKRKFTFSCGYMFTEYTMLLCIISVMLKRIASDKFIFVMFVFFIVLWFLFQLRLKIKKLCFIRVYGIHKKMHMRLSEYLNECAEYNHMDRTNMYIYGGDAKTPCNMIIFRGVQNNIIKNVLSDVDKFLKKYAVLSAVHEVLLLCINIAVVFIMLNGIV